MCPLTFIVREADELHATKFYKAVREEYYEKAMGILTEEDLQKKINLLKEA